MSRAKTTAPPKAGSVNPCGTARMFDAEGKYMGRCASTPNCRAYAFYAHPSLDLLQDPLDARSYTRATMDIPAKYDAAMRAYFDSLITLKR
jgi:hypothetical protein